MSRLEELPQGWTLGLVRGGRGGGGKEDILTAINIKLDNLLFVVGREEDTLLKERGDE
jgi:hypothetical protein